MNPFGYLAGFKVEQAFGELCETCQRTVLGAIIDGDSRDSSLLKNI
jgi:hypothetical protein